MEFLSLEPLIWLLVLVAVGVGLRYSLVDQPVWRQVLAALFRVGAIVALVFGLCRPYWLTPSDDLHVVFLVDVSDSVDLDAIASKLEADGVASFMASFDDLIDTLQQRIDAM